MNADRYYRQPEHRPMPTLNTLTLAESRHFRLTDFDLDKADELELWANFIESAALCSKMQRRRLMQAKTLANITSLLPPLSKRPIYDLSDHEAADLVVRLRQAATEQRVKHV